MAQHSKRKIYKSIIALAVAAGVVIGAFGLFSPSRKNEQAEQETAAVRRGELLISIETQGKAQAKRSEKISTEARSWRMTVTWVIDEGSEVEKDELLMKIEDKWLEDQVKNYEISVERVRAEYTNKQEQLKIQEAASATALVSAKFAAERAQMTQDVYGTVSLNDEGFIDEDNYAGADAPAKGEAYQKFRESALKIRKTETELEQAERDFDGMDGLLAKGFVTQNEYDDSELEVLEARRNLESSRLNHGILVRYTYPQEHAEKQAGARDTRDALTKAEIQAGSDILRAKTEMRTAELSLKSREKRLEEYKEYLEMLEIKAPVAGRVFYGDPGNWWSAQRISVGARVWPGMRLFTIPDTSEMIVESRVLEMDLYKVKVDQGVVLTSKALPGVILKGVISDIAQSTRGASWWRGEKWKYFGIEVELDEQDERLKVGMSCDVEIIIDRLRDALYVPVGAVFSEGKKRICYVVENGDRKAVEVETGQSSEKYVEILSGLEEDQQVLLGERPEEESEEERNGPGGGQGGPARMGGGVGHS